MAKPVYYFRCYWTNGKGGYNPDYEACGYESKSFKSLDLCIEAALEHDKKHGWCGWGYAPSDWENHSTHIYRKVKKEIAVGDAVELAKKYGE